MTDEEGHAVVEEETAQDVAVRIGATLRAARESRGRSVEEMAGTLKLTRTAIGSLESGDWERLGAPVYLRGYLATYARVLDAEIDDGLEWINREQERSREEVIEAMAVSAPRRRLRRYQRLISYGVATALLAIPAVLMLVRAFDGSLFARAEPVPATAQIEEQGTTATAATASDEPPVLASMTGLSGRRNDPVTVPQAALLPVSHADDDMASPPADGVDQNRSELIFVLGEEAWMDVRDGSGERLLYGLQPADSRHAFAVGGVLEIRIGNADAVTATLDGQPFDLEPHMRSDVASFTVGGEAADSGE